jgi:hypothetical protein
MENLVGIANFRSDRKCAVENSKAWQAAPGIPHLQQSSLEIFLTMRGTWRLSWKLGTLQAVINGNRVQPHLEFGKAFKTKVPGNMLAKRFWSVTVEDYATWA